MARKKNSNVKTYVFFGVLGLTALYLYTLNKNKMENSPDPQTSHDNMKDDMENPKKKKKRSTMDKVMFGLVIGGAIGSVLGLTVAPEKGKKVRNKIKKTSNKVIGKGKDLLDEHEDAVGLVTEKSKGIVSFFTDKIFGKKEKGDHSSILDWISDMDEIPSEAEEEISQ